MANMNTFAQVQNLPGPISTVETAVAAINQIGGISGVVTPIRALVGVRQDIAGGFFDGRPFKIRGVAKAIGTGVGNFTFNIYFNFGTNTNLLTFTNDVLVIGSGAVAVASKPAVAVLEALVMWDSSTNQVMGLKLDSFNNIVPTATIPVATPVVTASTLSTAGVTTNVSALQFFATFTSSAGITATTLTELALEQV
jgi:hypothetical protein